MAAQKPVSAVISRNALAVHRWVELRSPAGVISLLVLLGFLRTGIAVWNWFELSPGLLENWGTPSNPFQSNVLFNAFGTGWNAIFGTPDDAWWLLAQFVLAIASVGIIAVLVFRKTRVDSQYLGVALVLSSGIAAVLWREIGRYDFIFLVAVSIAMLSSRRAVIITALVIASFSAPEQALLAAIFLFGITLVSQFRHWRTTAMTFLITSIGALVLVQAWFTWGGKPFSTRLGLTLRHFSGEDIPSPGRFDTSQGPFATVFQKIYEGLAGGHLLLWSYLGSVTLVLIMLLVAQTRWRDVWVLLLFVIALPLATTLFFGEDPTRDLVVSGAPMMLALIVVGSTYLGEFAQRLPAGPGPWLTWGAILVTLLPTTYLFIRTEDPYDFLVHLLISWNNGTPIDWSGSAR